ncbi:MAG: class I SAM-dependent methyltransferase [Planctomycetota bacterium]|jgi:ubiquinone/menaquinone biosynthesis C-methylase UbiE
MRWLFAKLYDRMARGPEDAGVREWRRDLLAGAAGDVLELGAGTGLNLPHYPDTVGRLVLTEPDKHMRKQLGERAESLGRGSAVLVDAGAEQLPVPDASMDTVVTTLVLCSVRAPEQSLAEAFRVLRPGGVLLFLEHIASDSRGMARWQRWVEPFWRWFSAGCHLTRRTGELIERAGFEVQTLKEEAMPKAAGVVRRTIRGRARKPA